MRGWLVVVLALGTSAGPVLAQRVPQSVPAQDRAAERTVPGSRTGAPARMAPRPGNDAAQRETAAREKRWDERMKRVTRGLCVGC